LGERETQFCEGDFIFDMYLNFLNLVFFVKLFLAKAMRL
jgi:hypothetical protein